MTHRRNFLKSVSATALLPRAASSQTLPSPDDPAYWDRVRGQLMLAPDKVFFNVGTIGAMPRVVFERTVEHLRHMATDVADWDYKGEDWIAGYGDLPAIRIKTARLLNAGLQEVSWGGLSWHVSPLPHSRYHQWSACRHMDIAFVARSVRSPHSGMAPR